MRIVHIFILFTVMACFSSAGMSAIGPTRELYVAVSDAAAKSAGGVSVDEVLTRFGCRDLGSAFVLPPVQGARKATARSSALLARLASVRRVELPVGADAVLIARKLSAHPGIRYAEPVPRPQFFAIPNDSLYFHNGAYMSFINAPAAWDIARGDSIVVIAIVDSGTSYTHPDLAANVWINPGEIPGNLEDDDGNGYADDVHGWDFYGVRNPFGVAVGDAEPVSPFEDHGTHVAGIAAAVTDNGAGVASLSWNVRFMPVKISDDAGLDLAFGVEGIMYAAQNGADIINCSWGSYQYSRTEENVVSYVTSLGILFVSAAGNDGDERVSYPAGYADAVSVASVDQFGAKSSFSNYGSVVDVAASGEHILSTVSDSAYNLKSGTSMATPVVSALAALVMSAHPTWDVDQVRAQVIAGITPLTGVGQPNYLCGCGYIDAVKALGPPLPFVGVTAATFSDTNANGDGIFTRGETIEAALDLKNYGTALTGLTVTTVSLTGFSDPVDTSIALADIAHSDSASVANIRFTVRDDAPVDGIEYIRLDFKADGKVINHAIIEVMVHPSYATFTANALGLSLDGSGHIGWLDYPANTRGMSFVINAPSSGSHELYNVPLLFEGGLLLGTGPATVSDAIRGQDQGTQNADFILKTPFLFEKTGDGLMQRGVVVYTDDGAGAASTHVTVTSEVRAYADTDIDHAIMFHYTFINTGAETLTGMRAGLFFDFDIPDFAGSDDVAFYMPGDDIIVAAQDSVWGTDTLMIGIASLDTLATPWLIENAATDPVRFGIYDGFTDAEKWRSISAGKTGAVSVGPGDISLVAAAPPFTLAPGESGEAVFIAAYGFGYDELRTQIQAARTRAGTLVTSVAEPVTARMPVTFSIAGVYPNPFNARAAVEVDLSEAAPITLDLYDILGRRVARIASGHYTAGRHRFVINGDELGSGVYFVSLSARNGVRSLQKVTLLR